MEQPITECRGHREPWNKGKLIGQKVPLRLMEIWAIRIRLQRRGRTRELALFNLAVDSKLRSCDLVKLRVRDVTHGEHIAARAIVMQQKTQRPVQFEVTEQTRESLAAWIRSSCRRPPGGLPVSEPPACLSASVDTAGRADRPRVGEGDRPQPRRVWNPYTATHESLVDLSPHEESACSAAPARSFEAREHRSIPRHRGR